MVIIMYYFVALLIICNPLFSSTQSALEQLSNQLESLVKIIPKSDIPRVQLPINTHACSKGLLGLGATDYDLLLTTERYTPFREFLEAQIFPLTLILGPLLALYDIDDATDKNYQEFYFLVKDTSDKADYVMYQIIVFNFSRENLLDYSWYARVILNPNWGEQSSLPPLTDELRDVYLGVMAYTRDIPEELLRASLTPEALESEFIHMHKLRYEEQARNEQLAKKFQSEVFIESSIHERAKEVLRRFPGLQQHFIQYIKDWKAIEFENKRLASTIKIIANKRGLNISANSAVLYRTVYWEISTAPDIIVRIHEKPKRRGKKEVNLGSIRGKATVVANDVFDLWINNLPDSLQGLQWANSLERLKALNYNNFNIIIDPAISQKDIYDLIMKKRPKFPVVPPQDNSCLVLQLKSK
jgi:hypothetical protein